MQEIIEFDKELFLYLNNLGTGSWDKFWEIISYKFSWVPLYAVLLFVLYRYFGWKQALLIGVLAAIMVTLSDQTTNLFKDIIFKRPRPCFTEDLQNLFRSVDCEGRGRNGFTSAHASNHFALALFLGKILWKKNKLFLYILLIWASIIAYSRIYLGVHFPLDIFCGILLGTILGYIFYRLYTYIIKKFKFN